MFWCSVEMNISIVWNHVFLSFYVYYSLCAYMFILHFTYDIKCKSRRVWTLKNKLCLIQYYEWWQIQCNFHLTENKIITIRVLFIKHVLPFSCFLSQWHTVQLHKSNYYTAPALSYLFKSLPTLSLLDPSLYDWL